ncbi:unnamed protein product [Linum tenue]|uniref:RRM domain-containing protein n=1 Tax=Linum tenue TaxID=586396 RepID=A0AAV0IK85_9ROSI|nr:unnamed protein product [Linum tenue]
MSRIVGGGGNVNSVFYAESYHPIQAGSIDGTDVVPHDNAVYRAQLCSSAGLYEPSGDPKIIGDPYCTIFVGRLSHFTDDQSLRKAMSKYGHVKNLRIVRDIVTGASRGYAFVEFETEREMYRAYKDAHRSYVDDSEILVDYNRQQLMPGWIPRRLGGGFGGKKESGQLRFGGRDRPFRAPLRPIPYDELKRLGIPPPPEGKYMSRFEVPSPPRRSRSSRDREERQHHKKSSIDDKERSHRSRSKSESEEGYKRSSVASSKHHSGRKEEHYHDRSRQRDRDEEYHGRSTDIEERWRPSDTGEEEEEEEGSYRRRKHERRSERHKRKRSISQDYGSGR